MPLNKISVIYWPVTFLPFYWVWMAGLVGLTRGSSEQEAIPLMMINIWGLWVYGTELWMANIGQ